MLEKLINIFLKGTSGIKTKRMIETLLNDFIYVVYFIITFIAFYCVVIFNGTLGFILTALGFIVALSGWGWVAYHIRLTLMTLLYPPTDKTDENGDSMLSDEFEILNNTLKNLVENIKDMQKEEN